MGPAVGNGSSRDLQQRLFLLLQRCKESRQLSLLHAQVLLNGFSQKNFIVAKLLSSCLAAGDLLAAAATFRRVAQPTTTLFNLMIRAHSRGAATADAEAALLLYNQMRRSSTGAAAQPNCFTYSSLLNACARPSLLRQGEQLHARVASGGFLSNVFVETSLAGMYAEAAVEHAMEAAQRVFDDMRHPNIVAWNTMLAGYVRCSNIVSAFQLFDDMPERNVVSWTTMIAGCAQTGRCRQALSLFHEMRKARVGADQVTMVAVLSACADLGDLELGRRIHACIDRKKLHAVARQQVLERLVSLDNSLIHMYAKCGDIDEAHRIFLAMQRRSTVTWTTMIAGLAMHGRGEDALALFCDMEAATEKPDAVTFIAVLYACSHTGRINDGRRCFEHMTAAYRIRPRVEHYGCMVDLLSRAGRLSEAEELIRDMPVQPNEIVWGALLGGCRMHRCAELASYASGRLMELHPNKAANYLVLLSNTYVAAKQWAYVNKVRDKTVEMGMRKPAGRSWIHVNSSIHDFVAGNGTQPSR